jgi:hypothetical protein
MEKELQQTHARHALRLLEQVKISRAFFANNSDMPSV